MIFIKTSFWTVQESMGKVCLGRDRDKKISQDAQKQKKSKHKAELLIFKKNKNSDIPAAFQITDAQKVILSRVSIILG